MKIITMMYLEAHRETFLFIGVFSHFSLVIWGFLVSLALPTQILVNIPVVRFFFMNIIYSNRI